MAAYSGGEGGFVGLALGDFKFDSLGFVLCRLYGETDGGRFGLLPHALSVLLFKFHQQVAGGLSRLPDLFFSRALAGRLFLLLY